MFFNAYDDCPTLNLWRLDGEQRVVADVDALLPHGPRQHRLAAVDVRSLRLL